MSTRHRAGGPRTVQYLLSGRYLHVRSSNELRSALGRASKRGDSDPSIDPVSIITIIFHHYHPHLSFPSSPSAFHKPKTQTRAHAEDQSSILLGRPDPTESSVLVLHCAYSSCTRSSLFRYAAPVIAGRPLTSVKASTQRRPDLPFGRACFETRSRAKAD